jgi:hypothetical protein
MAPYRRLVAAPIVALISLAVAATPVGAATTRADQAVQSDMKNVATQLETFNTDFGRLPRVGEVQVTRPRVVVVGEATVRLSLGDRLGTVRLTSDRLWYCIRVTRGPKAGDTSKPWSYVSGEGVVAGRCPVRFTRVIY